MIAVENIRGGFPCFLFFKAKQTDGITSEPLKNVLCELMNIEEEKLFEINK